MAGAKTIIHSAPANSSKIIFWLEDNNRFFKELKIKDDEKFRKCWFSKHDSFLQKIEVSLISEEECNKIARRE